MIWLRIAAVLLAAVAAGGCESTAGVGTKELQATGVGGSGADAREAPELTPELLYDVIVAELAGQRGRLDISLGLYLDAARESRSPRIAERTTRIALYSGDQQAAREALALWIEISPGDLEARQTSAALYLRDAETANAVSELKQVVILAASSDEGFRRVVGLLGKEKDRAHALKVMQQLVGEFPEDPQAYFALGLTALHAGEFEVADQAVQRALELDPGWDTALTLRSRILGRQGREDEALDVMRQLVEARPDDLPTRLTYARMLVEAKRLDDGREQFRILLAGDPKEPDVLYALALLTLQTDDLDDAEDVFLQLTERGGHQQEAAYFLGQIHEERKNPDQAIGWYAKVERGDYYFPARIRTAVLQARGGELEEARSQLQRLRVQNEGLRVRLYLVEGEILRDADRLDDAMDVYNRALEEIPDNIDLLYARGLLAERMGRVDLLERDLSTIIESDPEHADALNALGYTLADRTDRYEEASEYIQRALALKPDNAAVIDSMGWLQYRLGNYAEAERFLRRALETFHDSEIAAHLGEVLLALGKREEARQLLEDALSKDPQSPLLLEVWKSLQ